MSLIKDKISKIQLPDIPGFTEENDQDNSNIRRVCGYMSKGMMGTQKKL